MSFAVVLEGVTLVVFLVMLGGGKQQRLSGWRVLSSVLFIVSIVEASGMAIVVRGPQPNMRFNWCHLC